MEEEEGEEEVMMSAPCGREKRMFGLDEFGDRTCAFHAPGLASWR